jgi:ABC-type transport system substrate-binding protein
LRPALDDLASFAIAPVPGEAVQLVKFDDYWQGKPALDKINLKVIDQAQIIKAMEKGDIDEFNKLNSLTWDDFLNFIWSNTNRIFSMQVTFDKKQENYLTGFITGPLLSKKYLSDVSSIR